LNQNSKKLSPVTSCAATYRSINYAPRKLKFSSPLLAEVSADIPANNEFAGLTLHLHHL
jgi:hypothetical protein